MKVNISKTSVMFVVLFCVAQPITAQATQVEDTQFEPDRGFFEVPFEVTITTATAGAAIYYTTDSSDPAPGNGILYDGPILIDGTTVLRAAAFLEGFEPTNIDTQTYIFIDDILRQPAQAPVGYPEFWEGYAADYGMDPEIVDDPRYHDLMPRSLLSLPSVSLVTDRSHLFDPDSGIYVNPEEQGVAWERPISMEWIDAIGLDGFQIDAGVRIAGAFFRQTRVSRKRSFRLVFKDDYGRTKLEHPLFEGAHDKFDTLILRAGANDAYTARRNWSNDRAQYTYDEFAHRTQLALGEAASHGRFVHLYLNGMYWGLYHLLERPDQSFAGSYFGGDKDEWDALNTGSPTGESSDQSWNDLLALVRSSGGDDNGWYQALQGNFEDQSPDPGAADLLDMQNYVAYMLANLWIGNEDWPHKNWYAACRRMPQSTGFKFFTWDSELSLDSHWSDVTTDVTDVFESVAEPYAALRDNAEFRMLFADIAHAALFNDGALTVQAAHDRYAALASEVEQAILGETARWGDQQEPPVFTIENWRAQRDFLLASYFPQRTGIVVQQLRAAGLYPGVDAPVFSQHGGLVGDGFQLGMTVQPQSELFYSLDGSDPREYGTGDAVGVVYSGPIAITANTQVKARVRRGGTWSALNRADFTVDAVSPLRVTEIMYHPRDPEGPESVYSASDFEYLEFTNTGHEAIGLAGIKVTSGVRFDLSDGTVRTLAPGERLLLVKNLEAFAIRYPNWRNLTIAGEYRGKLWRSTGSLSNSGEEIVIEDGIGRIVLAFAYSDDWYPSTDGEGRSLVMIDSAGDPETWGSAEFWKASHFIDGSPGRVDIVVVDDGMLRPATALE